MTTASDRAPPADAIAKATAADVEVRVSIAIGSLRVAGDVEVPADGVPLARLAPVFRGFAGIVVDHAVKAAEARGRSVSCCKGCGACCRQLVPIGESEARALCELIAAMPEARRREILRRFDDARETLEQAGLLERLRHAERFDDRDLGASALGLPYFRLGIACPFLDDESCSIHPERPIACREYLVTSPPRHCADPGSGPVEPVALVRKVSSAVNRIGADQEGRFARWVPLILAPEWVASHPEDLPPRSGLEWLRAFLAEFAGRELRDTDEMPAKAGGPDARNGSPG